jgi:hypothetical protein
MKNNRFVEILDDVPYSPEDWDEDESGLDILNKIIEDVKTFKEVRK